MTVRLLEGVGNSYPGDEGEIAVNLGGFPVGEAGGGAAVVGRQAAVAEPDRTHERSHGQVFRGLDRGGHRQGNALGSIGVQGIAVKIAGSGVPGARHDDGGGFVDVILVPQSISEPPASHPAERILYAAVPEEVFQPFAEVMVNVQNKAVFFRPIVAESREAGVVACIVDVETSGDTAVDKLVTQSRDSGFSEFAADA